MANLLQQLRTRVGHSLAYGRQPTPRPRPYQEMGVAGTAVWGGYVQVKERSPEWIGRQKWITATELAVNTSIVAASVHYFLNLVAYPKWTVRPSDDKDEEAQALAEFADHALNHMDSPWYKVVRRAAMYRFHGFGVQEWTAKHRDDGLIGFKDVEARPQHTIEQWDVDIDGTVLGMWQRSPQTGHMLGLPRDKVLYLVEDTLTDSPEGLGMFRHIADPYKRLKQLQELEIRAYERDLRGIPIARAPLTFINKAIKQGIIDRATADRMIADMQSMVELQVKQSDTGLVMDSMPYFSDSDAGDQVSAVPQWSFELLSGAGVGHAEIAAAIDRVQREIARIIGTEHLMMGDTGGNRALSEDKSRNLYLIANSVLKYIATSVKQDILVPMWKLNGFPMDKLPTPETEDVTFKNVEAITGALNKLASSGVPLMPNDPVVNDVRDLMGVSRVPENLQAQGAMPPALAGIPPELQLAMMGGKGGGPINLRPGAGALPKPPGAGGEDDEGKPFPAKKKGLNGVHKRPLPVEDEEEPSIVDETALGEPKGLPTRLGSMVNDPARVQAERKPNGKAPANPMLPSEAAEETTIDINGPKPGGKVEVDSALLVRLLERLTGGPVGGQPADAGDPTKPAAGGMDQAEPAPEDLLAGVVDGKDPAVEGTPADAKPVAEGPEGLPKPAAGAAGKPVAGKPKPGAPGQLAAPGKPAADAQLGKPAAGKKPPVAGKPGTQPPGAAKPGATPAPGEPGAQPQPGQPGAPGALPGQPGAVPGQPPPPKPEMDIERAVEILQPYADEPQAPLLDEDEGSSESDGLYERLGQEKDVQPVVADRDPMEELDGQFGDDEDDSAVGAGGTGGNKLVGVQGAGKAPAGPARRRISMGRAVPAKPKGKGIKPKGKWTP